jgi:hypothetical protein
MVAGSPRNAARLSSLNPDDLVRSLALGHDDLLASDVLRIKGVPLPPDTPVVDLERMLRCRHCDVKGALAVSIRWAAGYPRCSIRAV